MLGHLQASQVLGAKRTSPGAGSLLTAAEAAPPSAQWTTQADFLAQCSELAPSGIPADHPSMLAPLFHHPANHPLPYDALFNEIEAAMGATQAIKSGAAQAPRLSCLRDVLPAGTAQRSRPRIGIVVGFNPTADPRAQDTMYTRSLQDKQDYAARHGYEVVVFGNVTMHKDKHIYYLKWLGTLVHLRRFDWVWTVDLDTMIMDHSIPLESFLDPCYNVILTREVYMHNGDGIRDGPGDWPVHWGWYPEQAVVWKLSEQDRIRNKLKIVPQRVFNSYAGQVCDPGGTYREGDFMVHFAGPAGKSLFNEFWTKHRGGAANRSDPG